MAFKEFLVVFPLFLSFMIMTNAADPDITSDFVVPDGVTPDASFFTFTGLRQAGLQGAPNNVTFQVTKATQVEFPALAGQSVSYAVLHFAPGGVNAPHTHPRSAELLYVVRGWLQVGFVDSTNRLYTQTLAAGDVFVFPKGLVHYQINRNQRYPAVAISAFGSSNAGTVSLPKTVFGSAIENDVLAKSFKVDAPTVDKLVGANTMA